PGAWRRRPLLQSELAAGDDHSAAADLDALDLLRRAVDARVELGRAVELDPLGDLDLLAGRDETVADEVDAERSGSRAGGRILGDAAAGSEHPRLPRR